MNAKSARKPTFLDRIISPQLARVPKPEDPTQETHPRSSAKVCAATANLGGIPVVCELKPLHGGRHHAGARSWRPRSGDLS